MNVIIRRIAIKDKAAAIKSQARSTPLFIRFNRSAKTAAAN
jgi:hypothetical protein